jgi:hypothetical protein
MSTQPKSDAKAAAKRRALARRRNREIARHIFAYGIIAILVLGTVSTVLVQTAGAPTAPVVSVTPTTPDSSGFDQLLTQADQYVAASQWVSATGLYKAYLSQYPNRADVYLKLGKAVMNSPSPDYIEVSSDLQQAVSLAGTDTATSSEAQSLLTQLQPQIGTAVAAATATGPVASTETVTSTTTLTSTTVPLATSPGGAATASPPGTPIGPVIGTVPVSPSPATTPKP